MGQVLINDQVVFDEDSFLLFRADEPAVAPLRLGAIASRCLAQLLRSQGAVVRKRELMAGAWGQYGLEVTDNSLAQVVRQLRLALEKLQPGREFIQTLPRIGYKLAEGVQIVELPATAGSPAPSAATAEADPSQLVQPAPSVPHRDSASQPGTSAAPTTPDEFTIPAAHALRRPARRRWWPLLALPLWGALSFLLGAAWQAPSAEAPLTFAPALRVQGLRVHLPVAGLPALAEPRLQALALRSLQLAQLLDIEPGAARLYLLPTRHGQHAILCADALEEANSRCVGVQQHD